MYERFTDTALKVMQLANSEAQRINNHRLAPEHIFLGILGVQDCGAAHVLESFHDLNRFRTRLLQIVPLGPKTVSRRSLPLTPLAKNVVEAAEDGAVRAGKSYVSTVHLLLALLKQSQLDSLASRVLSDFDVTLGRASDLVRQLDGPEGNLPPPALAPLVVLTPELTQEWTKLIDGILCDAKVSTENAARMVQYLSTDGPERQILRAIMVLTGVQAQLHSAFDVFHE